MYVCMYVCMYIERSFYNSDKKLIRLTVKLYQGLHKYASEPRAATSTVTLPDSLRNVLLNCYSHSGKHSTEFSSFQV